MNCERARECLVELADRRLAASVAGDARAHLEGCAECRRELVELRAILDTLDGLPAERVSSRVRAGVREAIEAEKRALRAPRPRLGAPARRFRWRAATETLAACGLLALGYFAGTRHSAAPAADPDTQRELAELRAKVDSMRQLVASSLLEQRSANARRNVAEDKTRPLADLAPPTLNDTPHLVMEISFVHALQPPPPDIPNVDENLLILPANTGRWGRGIPVFEPSQLDQQPVQKVHAQPTYPFALRRAGISGQVIVDFIVDVTGEVHTPLAVSSSRREFEAAAVQAVSHWRFRPGWRDGRPVNTHLQMPVVFTLSTEE